MKISPSKIAFFAGSPGNSGTLNIDTHPKKRYLYNMTPPILYRRRIIPAECVPLTDDVILACRPDFILTSWYTLKPKVDLHHGFSAYYLNEGYKISKLLRADNSLICWYTDIVDYDWQPDKNTLTSIDLLVDVLVYPDGQVHVDDLDELVLALDQGLIDTQTLKRCLLTTDKLLRIIYDGGFEKLLKCFD